MLRRRSPDTVFTPRSAVVNDQMYVDRSELESRLSKLVSGTKHVIIHGESGNGKTWLYKKVLSENNTPYAVINLANAARFGSISEAIKDKVKKTKGDDKKLAQLVVNVEAGLMPQGMGIKGARQNFYQTVEQDPLATLMSLIRGVGGKRKGLIVFDNFEAILQDGALIKELASILILLDDEDLHAYDIKICIVGVPTDIRDYLNKAGTHQTLANRIAELPEVARLTREQASELLEKGFKLLKYRVAAQETVIDRILWSTDRIAQHLHELGLEVAHVAEANSLIIDMDAVAKAEAAWFADSLSSVREIVDNNMNARETKLGRRNQVLYAIGCAKTEDFKYSDIEAIVRDEFPESTEDVELNVIQRLSELEKSDFPVIKRVPKGDAYRVINPKAKIAIRVLLRKSDGRVEKVPTIT